MSDALPPLSFQWSGEAMIPLAPKLADKHLVVGQNYRMEIREETSSASRGHFFAALNEAHKNLPDEYLDRYPTVEHLRKWCLIKAGFRDERSIACASPEQATEVAAFVKPLDSYAVVVVRESTVYVLTAKTQSARAMNKAEFQKSKQAVLDIVSQLIGTDAATLRTNAAAAA